MNHRRGGQDTAELPVGYGTVQFLTGDQVLLPYVPVFFLYGGQRKKGHGDIPTTGRLLPGSRYFVIFWQRGIIGCLVGVEPGDAFVRQYDVSRIYLPADRRSLAYPSSEEPVNG